MDRAPAGLLVFRDGRRELSGRKSFDDVRDALRARRPLDALLCAGELECALSDRDAGHHAASARLTDALADALVGRGPAGAPLARAAAELERIQPPAVLHATRPEGFAYYALHPLDVADLAAGLPDMPPKAGVIGIRSIGTTLSAVAAAALRLRGLAPERITVRPRGHPYDRILELSSAEHQWVRALLAVNAHMIVVDEGPGLSGSSFLSVGDALTRAGVPVERITFLCSHAPDPDTLVAPDAGRRARCYRWRAIAAPARIPADAGAFLGAGAWRPLLAGGAPSAWPSCWPAFERLKYLSRDGRRLFKFEGLGPYGAEVLQRAERLAGAGFGPAPTDEGDGFASYPLLPGRHLRAGDLSAAVIERLADYCAFRASAFTAPRHEGALEAMVRANAGDGAPSLEVVRPVIADARMMPHEWLLSPAGALLKVDAASHGDDHFFPGPADIAWDLAGAVVEWRMDAAARRAFLDRYRSASGDRAEPRLGAYLFAYTTARLAFTTMASATSRDPDERARLERDCRHYRAWLRRGQRP